MTMHKRFPRRLLSAGLLVSLLLLTGCGGTKDSNTSKNASSKGSASAGSEIDSGSSALSGSQDAQSGGESNTAPGVSSKSGGSASTGKNSSRAVSSGGGAAAVKKIAFESSVWDAPAKIENVPELDYQGVRAIYYESVKYNGSSTKVFAYIGYPADASAGKKVPAVVLVHGGGGTAYADWVQQWTKRGYAAIAVDTEGHVPISPNSRTYKNHAQAGPARTGDFNDSFLALEKQWMYQACSAVIKAHSLLRGDSKIDSSKIGLCGISWGGIISSIVISQDDRFAFGAPIYGCGYLYDTTGHFSEVFRENPRAKELWDPSNWLSQVSMPILWVNDASDTHFSLFSTAKSQAAVKNSNMTVLPYLMHGHEYAWEDVQETYAFADSVVKSGKGLIKITKQPTAADPSVTFTVPQGVSVKNAQLVYSKPAYSIDWKNTQQCTANWMTTAAAVSGTSAKATLPAGTQAFYINVVDQNNLTVSSHMVTRSAGADESGAVSVVQQKFNSQTEFNNVFTSGNYENNPLKWGAVPSTVSAPYAASGGNDGGCMLVSNRRDWGDAVRIRVNSDVLKEGKTYRLSVDFKNGDANKGLYLTPTVVVYGLSSDASNQYPNKTEFMPAGCDLGRDTAANKSKWVRYTATFSIVRNGTSIVMNGFGGNITVKNADRGFVGMNLMFSSPGGNTPLYTCPFYMDNFTIEEII